jgi:hypothetical protein
MAHNPAAHNPALIRAANATNAMPYGMEAHPYTYGHDIQSNGASAKMSASSHNDLRAALLGPTGQAKPPSIPSEHAAQSHSDAPVTNYVDTDHVEDLCVQSDLAFEELWADGVWSMPSPIQGMMHAGNAGRRV